MPIGVGGAGAVEGVGIDEVGGVIGLAAERHGIAARGAGEAARGLHQPLGHRDIADAVGRFGELDEDAVGDRDRLMDDPQRAGAAEAGELEAGRRMALGDVAGHVDPAEEEGDARARPGAAASRAGGRPVRS